MGRMDGCQEGWRPFSYEISFHVCQGKSLICQGNVREIGKARPVATMQEYVVIILNFRQNNVQGGSRKAISFLMCVQILTLKQESPYSIRNRVRYLT